MPGLRRGGALMKPEFLLKPLVPSCQALFGPEMTTPAAQAMLLAIAMQESDLIHRQQLIGTSRNWWQSLNGPATGLWQFEKVGVEAVLNHRKAGPMAQRIVIDMGYPL